MNQLWGQGGTNTVDYEAQQAPVLVDLRAQAGYVLRGAKMTLADQMSSLQDAVGGSNDDTLIGDALNNVLDGGAGANALYGLAGNDTFVVSSADGGVEQMWGDSGINTVDYSRLSRSVDVDLADGDTMMLWGYEGDQGDPVWRLRDQLDKIQDHRQFGRIRCGRSCDGPPAGRRWRRQPVRACGNRPGHLRLHRRRRQQPGGRLRHDRRLQGRHRRDRRLGPGARF